jgi:uncharacterized protein YjiK
MKIYIYKLLILLGLFTACSADSSKSVFAIKGYDCADMHISVLEDPLKEISGVVYDSETNTFLAINDEHGTIYKLDAITYRILEKYHFGEKGDYEEIQFLNGTIYVLRSDGTIFKIHYDGKEIANVETIEYTEKKTEFESFYIKSVTNEFVLIPKNSKQEYKEKQTAAYILNLNTNEYRISDAYVLNWPDLKKTSVLHPSAVSIHPITKEIYLLASIEKLLIVMDESWKVSAEYALDPKYFQQPEGITFDIHANLYISNEAGDDKPTMIKIPIVTKK